MKVLVQRVREAGVEVNGDSIGAIGPGLLLLVGVHRDDDDQQPARLARRVLGYRLFADEQGRMNRSVQDHGGSLLVVPQFTLAADTRSGSRPGFSTAAPPERGQALYDAMVQALSASGVPVATGRFGADMQVHLVNDGPVTVLLQ